MDEKASIASPDYADRWKLSSYVVVKKDNEKVN